VEFKFSISISLLRSVSTAAKLLLVLYFGHSFTQPFQNCLILLLENYIIAFEGEYLSVGFSGLNGGTWVSYEEYLMVVVAIKQNTPPDSIFETCLLIQHYHRF
jgi:hypothetical protein